MDINPVAFSFFGIVDVRWYGILVTTGIVAGVLTAYFSAPKYGWQSDDIIDVALIAVPLAIVGARLYYVAFEWEYFAAHPENIIKTWHGGLAIWGGIIGGILGGVIYCKWKKRKLITLLDIALPGIAIGQAIGRWGNFVNQEAFGIAISNPDMAWFPFAVYIESTGQYHYATFFYESLWCLLVYVFLLAYRKRFRHQGDVALSYLMLYSLERMFVEGLRTDSLMWGSFRVSQVLSGLIFAAIAVFFILRRIREGRGGVRISNPLNPAYVAPLPIEPVSHADGTKADAEEHESASVNSGHEEPIREDAAESASEDPKQHTED